MRRALGILAVIACATLPLGSAGYQQRLVPTLVVGAVFTVLAIGGFRFVERRGRAWAPGYTGIQLALGFELFSLSGAAIGSVLLLVVLVAQTASLLPLPVAAVVAAVIPLVHLGMEWGAGLREGLGTLAVTTFTLVVAELLVREQRARADLAEAHERLRGYAAQAEQLATTQERNRVARDIHDGLGHHLTVVQILVQAARAVIRTADVERLDGILAQAQDQSERALAEVRRSVGALREPRSEPLVDALRLLAGEAGVPTGVEVRGVARAVRAEVEESLFRAAQEGLTNVRKHADATAATVVLDFGHDDVLRLEVRDDGRGLSEDPLPDTGFGLVGLRERVAGLGGRVSVDSSAGHGVTLAVEVPG